MILIVLLNKVKMPEEVREKIRAWLMRERQRGLATVAGVAVGAFVFFALWHASFLLVSKGSGGAYRTDLELWIHEIAGFVAFILAIMGACLAGKRVARRIDPTLRPTHREEEQNH